MKLFTGWVVTAGLVFGTANAQAQVPHEAGGSLYTQVSDFEGPYAAMPPEVAGPPPGPMLLPAWRAMPKAWSRWFRPTAAGSHF